MVELAGQQQGGAGVLRQVVLLTVSVTHRLEEAKVFQGFAWHMQDFSEWVKKHPESQLTRDLALNKQDIINITEKAAPNPFKYDKDEVRALQTSPLSTVVVLALLTAVPSRLGQLLQSLTLHTSHAGPLRGEVCHCIPRGTGQQSVLLPAANGGSVFRSRTHVTVFLTQSSAVRAWARNADGCNIWYEPQQGT
jgi:hypothetical protein